MGEMKTLTTPWQRVGLAVFWMCGGGRGGGSMRLDEELMVGEATAL